MKTIIVPTDFSPAAQHATIYAAELAKVMNASVLLLHVYQMPITMSDFPVLIVSAEELKHNADKGLNRVKEEAQKLVPGVLFATESRLGDVVEEIENSCSEKDVIALIIGTKDIGSFERFLLGNTAISIVRNCTTPVIAVPEKATVKVPRKIALAIDNGKHIPVQKIIDFADLLQAELHLVHIEVENKSSSLQLPNGLEQATLHSWKEDDITKGIQHFAEQNGIDLLLVLPHKHSLYERLFFKGHTQSLINSMPVPVMSIVETGK